MVAAVDPGPRRVVHREPAVRLAVGTPRGEVPPAGVGEDGRDEDDPPDRALPVRVPDVVTREERVDGPRRPRVAPVHAGVARVRDGPGPGPGAPAPPTPGRS